MAKNSLFGDNTLFSGFNLGQNNKDNTPFISSSNPLFSNFSSQDKNPEKTNKPEQPNSIFNNIGLFNQDIKKMNKIILEVEPIYLVVQCFKKR